LDNSSQDKGSKKASEYESSFVVSDDDDDSEKDINSDSYCISEKSCDSVVIANSKKRKRKKLDIDDESQ
jgi:hypothetical protein